MVELAELLARAATHQRAGNWPQAETLLREALVLAPLDLAIRRDLAWAIFRTGQRESGIAELRRAVAMAPYAALHNDLGIMLREGGHEDEGVAELETALRADPALWQAHFNLGNAHRDNGRFAEAVACYSAALRYAPTDPDVHVNLGVAQRSLGNFEAARRSFDEALRIQPNHLEALINRGTIESAGGDFQGAADYYRRALAINPTSALAHNNLGFALRRMNRLDEAIDSFRQALRFDPRYAAAHANLGKAYEASSDASQARACFADALRVTGDEAMKIKRVLTFPVIHESREEIEETRRQLARELAALAGEELQIVEPETSIGAPAFALAYHGRDDRSTQEQIAAILRKAAPELVFTARHCAAPRRPRADRIKIGFVSAHFREHTIGKLNAGVIRHLDRGKFHVTVFRMGKRDDEMSQFIASSADAWVSIASRVPTAQSQIAEHALDVLYYTDIGIDGPTYYLAHARLAPVQCVTWGHPLTTGIPTLDYFISSEHLEPPGSEVQYSEKLVCLPHLANYYYRPAPPFSTKTRRDFGLADDVHAYGCPQSLFKLHPDDDDVFARILRRDPRGRLVLVEGNFPSWTERLLGRFRRTMPDVCDRIRFVPTQQPRDFARLLASVDVLLDPLVFGGGDTSYQSFAVGAPVVTLPSGFLRGRITYALYRQMGVDDLIAQDADDYVERAVRLGNDRPWRDEVQAKILAAGDKIFDNPTGVRDLEAFLVEAIESQPAEASPP